MTNLVSHIISQQCELPRNKLDKTFEIFLQAIDNRLTPHTCQHKNY